MLTTAVHQITSQVGNVVDIDLRSNAVQASFVPTWSSRALSAEERAGIDLLIRNALKASVLPSNNTLPSNVRSMKFKALAGPQQAAAVLINTASAPGNPGTVTRVFLGGEDFAFAVTPRRSRRTSAATRRVHNQSHSRHTKYSDSRYYSTVTYKVTVFNAGVDPEPGRILVTIKGNADDNR